MSAALLLSPVPLAQPTLAFFVNPLLLGLGAALTSIPIIIHLLNRRRVRTLKWAAMTWLLAAMRRHQRRLRLENWLVLALRVAAILLLGLALARPVLTDSALAGFMGQKRSVYLVLDTSASTGARREARSVADAVKAEAGYVLEGLTSEDAFAVVLSNDPREDAATGREPSVLVPRTAGMNAVSRAREQVAALPPRDAPAAWPRALELVRSQLADEDVNRQVVIVTDLTARDWTQGRAVQRVAEPLKDLGRRGCRIRVIDVGGPIGRRANLALADIDVSRSDREPFQGRALPLSIRVWNWGNEPVEGALVTVEVTGGGIGEGFRRVRAAPKLDPADPATGEPGKALVDVDVPANVFRRAGSYLVKASVGPAPARANSDVLALDSVRYAPLRVRERVRILAWTNASQRAKLPPIAFLRPAFDPLPPEGPAAANAPPPVFELAHVEGNAESVFAQRLGGSGRGIDLVVLANAVPRNPVVQEALRAFVREGGGLLVFLGDQVEPNLVNEAFAVGNAGTRLLPHPVRPPELRPTGARSPQEPWHFRVETKSPAAWANTFTGPETTLWLGQRNPEVRGRLVFDVRRTPVPPTTPSPSPTPGPGSVEPTRPPATNPDEGVVLSWDDGTAAVVESRVGLGRTVWVGTTLDDGWMDGGVPFFLPVFLEEAALHLTHAGDTPRSILVGDLLEAVLPRAASAERLRSPAGKDVPLTRAAIDTASERPRVQASQTGVAGPWHLTWTQAEGGGEGGDWFAVNPDPTEGALQPADRGALRAEVGPDVPLEFLDSYRGLRREGLEVREGDVSRLALLLALGVLLLESLLAWWFGRRASLELEPTAPAAPGPAAPVPSSGAA